MNRSSRTDPCAHPLQHPLSRYGWDEAWADAFAPYADEGLAPARVVRVDRAHCEVVTAAGPELVTVRAGTGPVAVDDPTRAVCTGDWAALGPEAGERNTLRALLPRRTAFLRSASSKRSEGQVLAANVDHAVITVPLTTEADLGRLERYTALAWSAGARPVVALTKADLVSEQSVAPLLADAEAGCPGVPVLPVSATTGGGVEELAAELVRGTTVLVGQSGAGKSTLANALLGEEARRVQTVRRADDKGRHTTTDRSLLPLPGGGVLIDTPGLRGVGLWDAGDGVGRVFAEIETLAEECRFPDCSHRAEPDCAVLAAVADGTLAERRLESYRKLLRENERIAAKSDARLRAAIRRDWKQKQALGRHLMERKRGGRSGGDRRR